MLGRGAAVHAAALCSPARGPALHASLPPSPPRASSLGTLESTKEVYESILDLRIATPQIVLNYAAYMLENKFFEEAFRWAEAPGGAHPTRASSTARAPGLPLCDPPALRLHSFKRTQRPAGWGKQAGGQQGAARSGQPPPSLGPLCRVYERGIALFKYPHVKDIWTAYLTQARRPWLQLPAALQHPAWQGGVECQQASGAGDLEPQPAVLHMQQTGAHLPWLAAPAHPARRPAAARAAVCPAVRRQEGGAGARPVPPGN